MALNKIPDSLLSKFMCTKCKCYITRAPIAVEKDGQVSCESCTDWNVPQVRCNLLESLATLYAFPCKFKSAGCTKYLLFNECAEHEKKCEYHTFSCPIGLLSNTCQWEGTGTSMLRHYKRQHPQFSADHPNFKITLDDDYEKYYMIEIDRILLLLQIKSSVDLEKLWFSAVYIGETEKASYIRYRINLSCKDVSKQVIRLPSRCAVGIDSMKMDTEKSIEVSKKTLLEVLEGAKYIHCTWNVYVCSELEESIYNVDEGEDDHLIEAKSTITSCPNCNIPMVPPIYRCDNRESHVTCGDCKGYYNECKRCQMNGKMFTRADDLEAVSKLKFYNCRWTNCNEVFLYQNISMHEVKCPQRIFKCPKCYVWSGDDNALFAHFNISHPKQRLTRINPLFFNCLRFRPGYILTHNELFFVDIDMEHSKRTFTFSVTYCGPPSHIKDWAFLLYGRNGRDIPQYSNEANVVVFEKQPSYLVSYKLHILPA